MRLEQHSYSLLVEDDGTGTGQTFELEGSDPSVAMQFAQRQLPERQIEVLEDGRSLGKMKCTREGFWIVRPQQVRVLAASSPE
jgi:hypothetical protein